MKNLAIGSLLGCLLGVLLGQVNEREALHNWFWFMTGACVWEVGRRKVPIASK